MASKLTAKQIRYFGTKAQKAALRRRRSGAASSTSSAPRRRRRRKPKPALVRLWRWTKKHPVKAAASAAGIAGTAAIATSPQRRAAVARSAANVRSLLPK